MTEDSRKIDREGVADACGTEVEFGMGSDDGSHRTSWSSAGGVEPSPVRWRSSEGFWPSFRLILTG